VTRSAIIPNQPLQDLDQWDDFLEGRYREGKTQEEFRQYDATATPGVAEFYRLNHENMTVDYVMAKEEEYFTLRKGQKTIWEAAEFLNTLVDDSDPDTDLTQIEHLLQTSEAMRRDGQPRWMILTGFIHDLGKCLCLYGEPQWGVVGDTFPVGCAWSNDIVFPEYFAKNPDRKVALYQTKYGIYEPNCGLDDLHMSFGHDGYIAKVMKPYLRDDRFTCFAITRSIPGTNTEHTTICATRKIVPCWTGYSNSINTISTRRATPSLIWRS
jgi:inositol oxygenase